MTVTSQTSASRGMGGLYCLSFISCTMIQVSNSGRIRSPMAYNFTAIEKKWQRYWLEHKSFRALEPQEAGAMPKAYVLDMFPYPSGSGLHVGHPEGYTATDILSRYLRMKGNNVLHPMGWDAFGLPAEQHAIRSNEHPSIITKKSIDNFRRQIQMLGL